MDLEHPCISLTACIHANCPDCAYPHIKAFVDARRNEMNIVRGYN
jgi:hypothetical protein